MISLTNNKKLIKLSRNFKEKQRSITKQALSFSKFTNSSTAIWLGLNKVPKLSYHEDSVPTSNS